MGRIKSHNNDSDDMANGLLRKLPTFQQTD